MQMDFHEPRKWNAIQQTIEIFVTQNERNRRKKRTRVTVSLYSFGLTICSSSNERNECEKYDCADIVTIKNTSYSYNKVAHFLPPLGPNARVCGTFNIKLKLMSTSNGICC